MIQYLGRQEFQGQENAFDSRSRQRSCFSIVQRLVAAGCTLVSLSAASARWRTLPLEVGPSWMKDARESALWLRACARNVQEDDGPGRLRASRRGAISHTPAG